MIHGTRKTKERRNAKATPLLLGTIQFPEGVFQGPHGTNGGIRIDSTVQGQEFGPKKVSQFDGADSCGFGTATVIDS